VEQVESLASLCSRVRELCNEAQPFVLIAGGTDWIAERALQLPEEGAYPTLLQISTLAELSGIGLFAEKILRIGAATSLLEISAHPLLREHAPLLVRMAEEVSKTPTRARSTFGGQLAVASPTSESVAALAAYDAVVVVRNVDDERRIPFPELQTGFKQGNRAADEVIVAVELVLPGGDAHWEWRTTESLDGEPGPALAFAAIAEVEAGQAVRCGLGMASVGPTTALLPRTRQLILSTPLAKISRLALDKAVEADITSSGDLHAIDQDRVDLAKAVVREWLQRCATNQVGP